MKMVNFSFSIITETSGGSLKHGLGLWRDRRLCTHRKLAVKDAAPARRGRAPSGQAALTELRNLPTSSLRRLLSTDSDFAAESTCVEADPVSLAPRSTSAMLEETCEVPWAACWMLRDISCVAAPCSSTCLLYTSPSPRD